MEERLVLLSDIHGNLPALYAVAALIPTDVPVVVAGDHCLNGPCPAQVVDFLQERGWTCIMGNTDWDIAEAPESGRKANQAAWARAQLGLERVAWLRNLPFSATRVGGGESVLVVHANPLNMDEALHPTLSDEEFGPYLTEVSQDILAFGHLHTPYMRRVKNTLLVDVSSVGHPKDHDHRAVVTSICWAAGVRRVEQARVPYDLDETAALMRSCGIPGAEREIQSLYEASY